MTEELKILLTSKRALVALLVAIFDVLLLVGIGVPPGTAEALATLVTIIGSVLIGAISATDIAATKNQDLGFDHKGRTLDR